jgi:hypothetical protein
VSTSCHGGAHNCVCTKVLVMKMIECTHEGGVAPLLRSCMVAVSCHSPLPSTSLGGAMSSDYNTAHALMLGVHARTHTHDTRAHSHTCTHAAGPRTRHSDGQRSCTKHFMGDCGTVQPCTKCACMLACECGQHARVLLCVRRLTMRADEQTRASRRRMRMLPCTCV